MKTTDPDKNKRLNSFSVYMLLLAFMIHNKYIPNLQQHKSLTKVPFKYEMQYIKEDRRTDQHDKL